MDADKPKHKSGYRQNRELAIICALWGVLIFFRLDELIGAVGLRHVYLIGSIIVALVLLTRILVFDVRWNNRSWVSLILSMLILVICGMIAGVLVFLVWYLDAAMAALLPARIFVLGFLLSLTIWFSYRFRSKDFNPSFVKWSVTLMTVFTMILILGIGFRSGGEIVSSEWFEGHQYYLIADQGYLGDSDTVIFYECNTWALACKDIHVFHVRDYLDAQILLIPRSESHQISVIVDGELLRYTPS